MGIVRLLVTALATSSAGAPLWVGCTRRPPPPPATTAIVAARVIDEASGLAPSRQTTDLLWTHNDSDGQPVLYALDAEGRLRGTLRIAGVKNRDWEDLASFVLDGVPYLIVGDIGDNFAKRTDCALYVVAEPAPAQLSPTRETVATIAWQIPVRYADGPHDCESIAVEPRENAVYLLNKRSHPNPLLTLPLRPTAPEPTPAASEVARVARVPQPDSQQRVFPTSAGRYRGQPTAMDFSADGRFALVLTYGDLLLFPRHPGERWSAALTREPVILGPHGLSQAEAACFSADSRSIFVTEERENPPLLRYAAPTTTTP